MTQPLLVRCDASPTIGSGHVMRCLTLIRAFAERPVTFACAEIGDALAQRIIQGGHQLIRLPGPRGGAADRAAFLDLVAGASAVIMDGYAYDRGYRRDVRAIGRPVLALDDTADTELCADVVVNPSPSAVDLPYGTGSTLLLGPDYALVAPGIVGWHDHPVAGDGPLLLTFGGSDPVGLTLPLARALQSRLPQAPIRAVLGGAVRDLAATREQLRALAVDVAVDVAEMGPVLRQCRMAVSAAGSTMYELAALGRPMLLCVVADNQDAAARRAAEEGWAWCEQGRTVLAVDRIADRAFRLWGDDTARTGISASAARRVDGGGADRIAAAFRPLFG